MFLLTVSPLSAITLNTSPNDHCFGKESYVATPKRHGGVELPNFWLYYIVTQLQHMVGGMIRPA